MESLLTNIDLDGDFTLNELRAWMDGGSVELLLADHKQTAFTVVFCQRMGLRIHPNSGTWIPGSFLFNEAEISIRSTDERFILTALKTVRFSDKTPRKDRPLERKIISDCISFVESDYYLEVAKVMGRL